MCIHIEARQLTNSLHFPVNDLTSPPHLPPAENFPAQTGDRTCRTININKVFVFCFFFFKSSTLGVSSSAAWLVLSLPYKCFKMLNILQGRQCCYQLYNLLLSMAFLTID